MKSIKALFVLALGLALAAPAFAETQNVKVSGSIDAYAIIRSEFDLRKNDAATRSTTAAALGTNVNKSDSDEYFMTITQIQINADLTDNVSTVVNLINQRDWNAAAFDTAASTGNAANEFDVILDLAYVQMKEIFYSPLTLTIGRQDLVFGRGFILGWNPQDPSGAIVADEFTQVQSFDAVRATLDFNPWTIDWVYAKVDENHTGPEDDSSFFWTNVNYKFAEYNAVAEAYMMNQLDRSSVATANAATIAAAVGAIASGDTKTNDTHTIGGRVQFDPITQITLGAELAYQMGSYYATSLTPERDREAWAMDIFGEYRFDNAWKPMLGLQFVHLSGEPDAGAGSVGDYGAWNGAFRLPVYGWIHDYREVFYSTAQTTDQAAGQNQNHISVYGSINPLEDLKLTANYWHFWTDEDVFTTPGNLGSQTLNENIGDEIDLAAIYAYTEDVTFTFMANWFFPGDHFLGGSNETASEYISEVKVTF